MKADEIYSIIRKHPVGYVYFGVDECCTFFRFECKNVELRHFSSGVPYILLTRRGRFAKQLPNFILKGYEHEVELQEWDDGIDLSFKIGGIPVWLKLKNDLSIV